MARGRRRQVVIHFSCREKKQEAAGLGITRGGAFNVGVVCMGERKAGHWTSREQAMQTVGPLVLLMCALARSLGVDGSGSAG